MRNLIIAFVLMFSTVTFAQMSFNFDNTDNVGYTTMKSISVVPTGILKKNQVYRSGNAMQNISVKISNNISPSRIS